MNTMYDLASRRARLDPERLAVEDLSDGTRYTYRAFNERAARFAAAAREHWGVQEGERVAWLGHSRAEVFAMLFGCAKANLIFVPLNWRLAVPELTVLLDDATPKVLLYAEEFAATAQALAAARPDIRCVALADYHRDLNQVTPDLTPHPDRPGDTPWYLLYTSGTTGKPKGVIQTFAMMVANYWNIGVTVGLTRADTLLNVLPMFHTAGLNLYSSCMFLVGGAVLVQRQFDPAQAHQVLGERANVFFGVPAIYQALLHHPDFDGAKLARVRSWGCGGAALPVGIARAWADHGIRIRSGMGMTETGPTVFLLNEEDVLTKPGVAGRAQLLVEVRVVDADGHDVAQGEAGELWVRGPGITPGYWQRPEATRDAILPGGWLRSGDVVRCDADGDYTIVDRWKDMYISGGENVYPAEVEAVLLQHPDILEAAVVGMPDERWGEVGHASLVLKPDRQAPDDGDLRAFCRARLAGYKVPKVFVIRPVLPRNALGKVIKEELRRAARS